MAKLLRKDVLKWLRNLRSGAYRKGKNELVNSAGTHFCCLGVWADQHGVTWKELDFVTTVELIPIAAGHAKPQKDQTAGKLSSWLKYGLTDVEQTNLVSLNDSSSTWKSVIDYIEKEILPRAK